MEAKNTNEFQPLARDEAGIDSSLLLQEIKTKNFGVVITPEYVNQKSLNVKTKKSIVTDDPGEVYDF